jgi:hypothetical protein
MTNQKKKKQTNNEPQRTRLKMRRQTIRTASGHRRQSSAGCRDTRQTLSGRIRTRPHQSCLGRGGFKQKEKKEKSRESKNARNSKIKKVSAGAGKKKKKKHAKAYESSIH